MKEREDTTPSIGRMTNSEIGPSKAHPNVIKVENRNRKLRHEEANAFDDNGNVVLSKGGNSNSVGFRPYECAKVANTTFTHNHPGGSIFSAEDVVFTVKNNLKEMRATQPDGGVYSLKRVGTVNPTFMDKYKENYHISVGAAKFKMDQYVPKLMAQGKVSSADANRMFSQKINDEFIPWLKKNAGKYGYEFTHTAGKSGILNKAFDSSIEKSKDESKDMIYLDKDTNAEIEKIVNEWYEKSKKLKDVKKAITFTDLLKFNPYHDRLGRFATKGGFMNSSWSGDKDRQAMTFSANPNTTYGAKAIEREAVMSHESIGRAYNNPAFAPKDAPVTKPPKKSGKTTEKAPKKDGKETESKQNMPSSTNNKSQLPDKILNKCREVEAKTVNRKTEKMTVIDDDGNILLEKSGGRGSVSFGAREGFILDRQTITHNHPGEFGGTFSGADIKVMVDYKLKAIRAVAKEGTYSLERTEKVNSNSAYELKESFKKSSNEVNRTMRKEYNAMKPKVMRGEITPEEANKQLSNIRTSLCNKQHEYLKKLAKDNGFIYVYEPAKTKGGVAKMFNELIDNITKASDTSAEVVLDGEFMSGDNWMIK